MRVIEGEREKEDGDEQEEEGGERLKQKATLPRNPGTRVLQPFKHSVGVHGELIV